MRGRRPVPINDADDPRLAVFRMRDRQLSTRAERRDNESPGRFLAEGDLVVDRALAAGCRPLGAIVGVDQQRGELAERLTEAGATVYAASDAVRQRVLHFGAVQPIVAVFERRPRPSVADVAGGTHRLVAIEAVDNPANIGSIVRNAAALGWGGIILDRTAADPLARRALRVAMGTTFSIPHARTEDLAGTIAGLTADGWAAIALALRDDAVDIDSLGRIERCALVIGSERAGLSDDVVDACTHVGRIPMRSGVDSLNAAAASAIACYVLG